MLRLLYIITLLAITSCINYKKYRRQEIIETKTDLTGRLILKKYRQLISSPSHNKLATITQEYDSLGRIIKEYGFDNPFFYDQKYLTERVYHGTQVYIFNKFLWGKTDTTNDFGNYDTRLLEQRIFPDSLDKHKEINISLTQKENQVYYGQFEETFPVSPNSWTTDLYIFTIAEKNILFDSERKLILDSISKIK